MRERKMERIESCFFYITDSSFLEWNSLKPLSPVLYKILFFKRHICAVHPPMNFAQYQVAFSLKRYHILQLPYKIELHLQLEGFTV